MKKINGFQITKMTLSGFKCFEEEASFTFGDTTYITASNGKGKSSIADAAAFAFVGTPFFGEKGLDRLQNKEMDEMTVSVDIVDDTGKPHHLTRTRKRDSTLISYDGTTVRQSDLNTAFGGRDIFLSILNPLYFISVLGDGGKNLLEKLLPAVKQEDVLASLPKCSQEALAGQSLLSPETFIKNRRCELKKLNEALISYQGKKELVEQQREERAGKLEELRITVENISKEMEELMEVRDKGRNPDEEKALLAQLHKQRESLLAECTDNKTDEAIRQLAEDIKSIEKSMAKQEAELYVSSYMEQMAETEARLKNLYTEHKKMESALRHTEVGYRCPVCMSVITDENIVSVESLSRLGRSTKDLIDLTELFEQKGVHLVSLKESIDTSTSTGKLLFTLMSAIAQFERDTIADRTREGLRSARARGRKGGRPRVNPGCIQKAVKLYHSKQYSIKEIEELTGVKKSTLYRNL